MIFDLYLQGLGSMKIANILTEQKRKTASNVVKWSLSNITRVIRNATYAGLIGYNKSRSNNFLEQKRVLNLDMSTYEYVQGEFPAIVSPEIWEKAQQIREKRVKPAMVTADRITYSRRDSKDIWLNKLRCTCGSSFCKLKWHINKDGRKVCGYQCYNRRNNRDKKKREELGLDTVGYCGTAMIADWKMDLMATTIFETIWEKRADSVQLAAELIKQYYKNERCIDNKLDHTNLQSKMAKAQERLKSLIVMRADGEISKDEYQAMRTPIDEEIKSLQTQMENDRQKKTEHNDLNLDGILVSLRSMIDFGDSKIDHRIVDQFVYKVTPTSDHTFDWYLNLNGNCNVRAKMSLIGHKKSCIVELEEIEKFSSLHRMAKADMIAYLLNTPSILSLLHRLH